MRLGDLRRLRFALEIGGDSARKNAERALARILLDDPNSAYAGLLGARHGLWNPADHGLPGFAATFERVLADENRQCLEALATTHPPLRALTLVARALFGDVAAAAESECWLRDSAPAREPTPLAALRSGLMSVLRVIDGGRSALSAFADSRAATMRVLHDVNEAALAA